MLVADCVCGNVPVQDPFACNLPLSIHCTAVAIVAILPKEL